MFSLESFINKFVTKRPSSMFYPDIESNKDALNKKIQGKSVLVIGGAGSIGSSFIKAILPFKPASLVVVDTNENALTELTRDLRSTKGMFVPEDYVTYPMDFASPVFEKMFRNRGGFNIVGNFSAHKHVRSEKDIYSVEALLKNNVLHAKLLLDLLSELPPEEYFCVSTDKAANPVNIMGASKRIMEDVIFSYSDKFPVKTARFANVAFSNGSLPAGFLSRIQKLQPLSAPSDVRRYFVSPEESGQICLLSCILGENRNIFFPKLEEAQMMTFDSIGTELLKVHGYEVLECDSDEEAIDKAEDLKNGSNLYPVHYSASDTSGEKPFEEFVTDSETADYDRFSSLGVITGKEIPDKSRVEKLFKELNAAFDKESTTKEEVVAIMKDYLPNFEHIETGKSLDSKM
ncbi:Polysaccharide biosynthesis protein [Eubacterium ruminantium]|uniref:Polysaccharide biosynthesis protein n=1 Tax=Eubacterium ruminantium TaxID=42322 RepID=A0A1T4LTP3_9FIRM|nr:polysaccharide biosynthesis protein [Eubacterium ruminantium]SCW39775.1 Polysaccharide biosynthesis protein [Eubacterium ruminantium]SDM41233.1 Polysaccharide biosynthesis protein [Eubacterium ruminantium]SJZ57908.1 Polysaccharide biosynthesis protein [Eubacterium ruminantium]